MSADRVYYDIIHTTRYAYSEPVSLAQHVARLTPRDSERQSCLRHDLEVVPAPDTLVTHVDYFGNTTTFFAVGDAHDGLTVHARSRVAVSPSPVLEPSASLPWEQAVDRSTWPFEVQEFVFDGPSSQATDDIAVYARASFAAGRPLVEAVVDLTGRIHRDLTYDPDATTVETSVSEVFNSKRGVCQDFARLEIACLRAMGLPVRYVSGYLETVPLADTPRLVGADASHAWLAVYCPGIGWFDVDPTNNVLPSHRHVTVAWGRDYGDVSPVRGVFVGGGPHTLHVSVDVLPTGAADED